MKTLLIGLAAGLAIGYFLASEDAEELINDAKAAMNKGKDYIREGVKKGKEAFTEAKENWQEV